MSSGMAFFFGFRGEQVHRNAANSFAVGTLRFAPAPLNLALYLSKSSAYLGLRKVRL
jgi:hypothetical protein